MRPSNPRTTSLALAVVALVALTGAKRVDEKNAAYKNKDGQYTVQLPIGWVMHGFGKTVSVSRDGFGLHVATIERIALKDAFKDQMKEQTKDKAKAAADGERTTKVVLTADSTPEELAELHIAERKRAAERTEVLGNEPATVAGLPAFRVTTEFKDDRGLRNRMLCYGFIAGDGLVRGCYRAPALHYYDRDLPAFESMIASLAYVPKAKKKK